MLTERLTFSYLRYRLRKSIDRYRGLDFLGVLSQEEAGVDRATSETSSPSGGAHLERVLKHLSITQRDAIVDVGCGKGSAMRSMLKHPFARVDGIELSRRAADVAIRNFQRMRATRTRVFVTDAAAFEHYADYTFVYFYNPFTCDIMSAVMDKLTGSLRERDRDLVIVYNHPVCHEIIVRGGIFVKTADYPADWGNRIFVYSNKGPEGRRTELRRSIKKAALR